MTQKPLLSLQNVSKQFPIGKKVLTAVDGFSLDIYPGETVGLVGESGSGKSTVGRLSLYLQKPTTGSVLFDGFDLSLLSSREIRKMRRRFQMIFQDPYASLNPRMTVQDTIGEAFDIHKLVSKKQREEKIVELLESVGLDQSHLSRFPHEFSGGQRQRIGIARALAVEPGFIVCDEPISALDVSIRAQIINLLKKLQKEKGLTYLFIAHDLSMIKYLSDRVAVMYLGHLVELASSQELYSKPLHPYTQALLASIPIPDPVIEKKRERILLQGEAQNSSNSSVGCPFQHRCPFAQAICKEKKPLFEEVTPGHFAACHFAKNWL